MRRKERERSVMENGSEFDKVVRQGLRQSEGSCDAVDVGTECSPSPQPSPPRGRGRAQRAAVEMVVFIAMLIVGVALNARGSEFADAVVSYDPGIGYVAGFTNAEAALGEPSRVNPFGDPTDPFDPPYGKQQIVSIGAGGSLTVYFQTPILNHPNNVYGLDFTIFGNA